MSLYNISKDIPIKNVMKSMKTITQTEIDNLPHPPQEWLDDIKRESKTVAKKHANIIKNFWDNPVLLKTKKNITRQYIDNSSFFSSAIITDTEMGLECLKQQKPEVYQNIINWGVGDVPMINGVTIKNELSKPKRNKMGTKYYFYMHETFIYPRGLELKKACPYEQHNRHCQDITTKLYSVKNCFNIIQKEFKILQVEKKDFYSRYYTYKPFEPYEECGIEVMYARKGYAVDGKRLPNFNRGSVFGLRQSIKENNIKMKDVGGNKKDDLIKFLIKL